MKSKKQNFIKELFLFLLFYSLLSCESHRIEIDDLQGKWESLNVDEKIKIWVKEDTMIWYSSLMNEILLKRIEISNDSLLIFDYSDNLLSNYPHSGQLLFLSNDSIKLIANSDNYIVFYRYDSCIKCNLKDILIDDFND